MVLGAPRETHRLRFVLAHDQPGSRYTIAWSGPDTSDETEDLSGGMTSVEGIHYPGEAIDVRFAMDPGVVDRMEIRLWQEDPQAVSLGSLTLYGIALPVLRLDTEGMASVFRLDAEDGGIQLIADGEALRDALDVAAARMWQYRIACVAVLALCAVLLAALVCSDRLRGRIAERMEAVHIRMFRQGRVAFRQYIGFAATMLALIALLYAPYLSGQRYFMFMDDSYDSFVQLTPTLLGYAKSLWNGGLPSFQFTYALGQESQNVLPVFDYLTILFGPQAVPRMMIVTYSVKLFLAGSFFYAFLARKGCRTATQYLCGLGYAFCGRMVVFGTMQTYPGEVALLALLLWAMERFYQNRRSWKLLALSFILLASNASFYQVILYSGVLWAYALFRREAGDLARAGSARRYFGTVAGVWAMGTIVSLYVVYPEVSSFFQSARVSQSVLGESESSLSRLLGSYAISDGFFLRGKSQETVLLSLVSSGVMGMPHGDGGIGQVYRVPVLYASACVALMFPQAFAGSTKKAKAWYAIGLGAAALYLFVPWVHNLANLMTYPTYNYKLASLWIVVLLLYMAATALDRLFAKRMLNLPLLWGTAALLGGLPLVLALMGSGDVLWGYALGASAAVLGVATVLTLLRLRSSSHLLRMALIALTVLDVAGNAAGYAYYRESVTPERYEATYANGLDALTLELQADPNDIFRVVYASRTVPMPLQNFAPAYGYNGIAIYRGGTFFGEDYSRFLLTLKRSDTAIATFRGFDGILEANTLAGVRYLIMDGSYDSITAWVPYGYERIATAYDDTFTVYENKHALPIGFVYDGALSYSAFSELSLGGRYRSLLRNAVLEDGAAPLDMLHAQGRAPFTVSVPWTNAEAEVTVEAPWTKVRVPEEARGESGALVSFVARITSSLDANVRLRLITSDSPSDTVLYAQRGVNQFALPLDLRGVTEIWLQSTDGGTIGEGVTIQPLAPEYWTEYEAAVAERSRNPLTVINWSNEQIEGTVNSSSDGLLFLSIPYSEAWKIRVDDQLVDPVKTNMLFMSVPVTAGEHSVTLQYRPAARTALGWASLVIVLGLTAAGLSGGVQSIRRRRGNRPDATA